MHNSESKYCYNVRPLTCDFYVKTKISIDFQICISVPLSNSEAYLEPCRMSELECFAKIVKLEAVNFFC